MDIARLDPYLVKWSSDGELAIATESSGLLIFFLDCKALLQSELKWIRTRASLPESGRVIDMDWSPTFHTDDARCQLVCVTDAGNAYIVRIAGNTTDVHACLSAAFSAGCWLPDGCLVLGDNEGIVHAFKDETEIWKTQPDNMKVGRIVSLVASVDRIGVVTDEQKCWVVQNRYRWTPVLPESQKRVDAVGFYEGSLLVQRGSELLGDKFRIKLESYLPGSILSHKDGVTVIHADGTVSGSMGANIPTIDGEILGLVVNESISIALVIVARQSSLKSWEFPILSSKSVRLSLFPFGDISVLPRRLNNAAPASWLPFLVHKEVPLKPPRPFSASSTKDTETSLKELFLSEWFDFQRARWYKFTSERQQTEKTMRESIASILRTGTPSTDYDKLLVSLYSNEPYEPFTLCGDSLRETFSLHGQSEDLMVSESGKKWRRCAITRLPLVSLDTIASADGHFSRYSSLPQRLGSENEQSNPLCEALLRAANFCVFTGAPWTQ